MATRWIALLIVSAACSAPQQGVQGPGAGSDPVHASAHWWCVYSVDGYSSHCERTQSECERMRNRVRRTEGPCSPEPAAHCFRYINKSIALSDAVELTCSAEQQHCDERRARAVEADQRNKMVGDCEVMD